MGHHQELPGFRYDEEKNRYFPLRGPIPGAPAATPSSTSSSASKNISPHSYPHTQARRKGVINKRRRSRLLNKLLAARELNGNLSFVHHFQNLQLSHPLVWKYHPTERLGDAGLDQIFLDIQTPLGLRQLDFLIAAGLNGSFSLFEVGNSGPPFDSGVTCIPDRVWPEVKENKPDCIKAPQHIWRSPAVSHQMSSRISCIKLPNKRWPHSADAASNLQHALITTLGSETSGGSVCTLNLVEPLDYHSSNPVRQMVHEVASFNCTIWTADCNHDASQAVIGSNLGAALVNLETGMTSWVLRSKSDVLAQQFDLSGNVVLCGLRNGTIVTVDVREKHERPFVRLMQHRIPFPLSRHHRNPSKQWFELKGDISPSCTVCMPSSVCCLVSLLSYDQYFLASSMDGSILLYDHRMTKRGAVQTYDGHVNSHSLLQLGVDQSERYLLAGGEDSNLRLWSIQSGELLFEERFSDSVPLTVSWQTSERLVRTMEEGRSCQDHRWGAWFGSQEGIFLMHWT